VCKPRERVRRFEHQFAMARKLQMKFLVKKMRRGQ